MTKRQEAIVNTYRNSQAYFLSDVYNSYSKAKENSFKAIEQEMMNCNGHTLKILTANTFQYTCAYKYDEVVGNEVILHLVYHTASKRDDIIYNRYER